MNDGLIRVAAASPHLLVADCAANADEIVKTAWRASTEGAHLLVTPELGITGYTCGDLFGQQHLLDEAVKALATICKETSDLQLLLAVGLPVRHNGKLYNCAAVLQGGRVLGLVPKTYLPNYGEFYELRQFASGGAVEDFINLPPFGTLPFGTKLLFRCEEMPQLVLAAEICEDLWVPQPPSGGHVAAGATVVANLSASSETVGKAEYRRLLVKGQSAKLVCGYVYADAGHGESTTDMVFSGHNLICENGVVLAETAPFDEGLALAEIDLELLLQERRRLNTFFASYAGGYETVPFHMELRETPLSRAISPLPFQPGQNSELPGRCESILAIQAQGLRKRLEHTGAKTAVVGVSGGLDSTLALLVTCRAFRLLSKPAREILAVTMPGFGTTERTKGNAAALCEALGVTLKTIDITKSVRAHFADIDQDEKCRDTTYENAQARMRTLVLMDLANQNGGLVVGTGDLSELALGWATYNGDHMSMYGVNAGVPKTLIRALVAHEAEKDKKAGRVLRDVLDTPVSPELLPPKEGRISQQTEEIVGPYELHDFFLFYTLRYGFRPRKLYRYAQKAFEGRYEAPEILRWMQVFFSRFFCQQFKRSCLPDGPKVGSVSLSPRGDWRMPSDAAARAWVAEAQALSAES
ncbi:NAD(+) synthase [Ruminococcaceae bacterium OttesenSCG-928-I18]|nr:NAD(+) synthase [Ruminococcaceae bacterium OttesenSCG-928-I18]